jgi:pilin isopeptide linkage protein
MGLNGFKFQLVGVEKTGTATAESDDKGEAKFTLTFTADDIGKTFTYKLSEVNTEVADVTYDETVYEIKVAVGQNKTTGEIILTVTRDGKTVEKAAEFVNTYAPAPEKEPEKDPDESPKTMDDFRLGGWLLMMSVSAVCLLAVIVLGKKFNV